MEHYGARSSSAARSRMLTAAPQEQPVPGRGAGRWFAALALVAAFLYLGWVGSGLMGGPETVWDDHYITYRYGRNLAEGHGLRFNAADPAPTEGFSSLLHVLLSAAAFRLGLDPLAATRGASLACFLLIPVAIGIPLARLLCLPAVTTLTVACAAEMLLLLTRATPFNLALGMETILYMGAVAALAGWSLLECSPRAASHRSPALRLVAGLLAAALVAVGRPEGPLLVGLTIAAVAVGRRLLPEAPGPASDRSLLAFAVLAAAGFAGYLAWKRLTFGYLLPNPYYVKSHNAILGGAGTPFPGWGEVRSFLLLVLPWAAAGVPLWFLARESAARRALLACAAPGAVVVLAYARAIHEAAFGYRYEFPYLVHLQIPLVGLLSLLAARRRAAAPLLVAVAAVVTGAFFVPREALRRPPTAWLRVRVGAERFPLVSIGKDLARTGLGQRGTIAVTAAGAIPYFSGLRALDLVGLNDPFLCGRAAHTVDEAWAYVEGFKPDLIQSSLPPATPGFGVDQDDPVQRSQAFAMTLAGRGSELARTWDRGKLLRSLRLEAIELRDRYTLGAAYYGGDGWILLYLRRDSPNRGLIAQTLERLSYSMDRETDLKPFFGNDPRQL
jgi:hypothetical protein